MTVWDRVKHMVTQVPIFREQAIEKLIQSHDEIKQGDRVKQKDFNLGQQVLIKRKPSPHEKRDLNKNGKDLSRSQKYFLTELIELGII